jgi:hypothetical protein
LLRVIRAIRGLYLLRVIRAIRGLYLLRVIRVIRGLYLVNVIRVIRGCISSVCDACNPWLDFSPSRVGTSDLGLNSNLSSFPWLQFGLHGHARLQHPAAIVSRHLDPIHQLRSFFCGLDVPRRELRFG